MLELWNLMDTPVEEQQEFQNVTCNIAASEHEITEPNTLSLDFIKYVSYRCIVSCLFFFCKNEQLAQRISK
jgi:hypothetical protein